MNNVANEKHKCPICEKYVFEEENSFDICPYCGWEDDGVQYDDKKYWGGANEFSQVDYKKTYEEIIKKNPDFYWERDYKTVNFGKEVEEKHFCPVCKKTEFDSLDSHKQCKYCGWIDNMTQEKYPDFKNSSNELSLEEYKENYNRLVSENENYEWSEDN